jgi:hypothetical protein
LKQVSSAIQEAHDWKFTAVALIGLGTPRARRAMLPPERWHAPRLSPFAARRAQPVTGPCASKVSLPSHAALDQPAVAARLLGAAESTAILRNC